MALSKADKQEIADLISASKDNDNDDNGNVDSDGDVVILRGDVAKEFLEAMGSGDGGNEPKEPKEDKWTGFGKKYFGGSK